jgi:hypothetical protein
MFARLAAALVLVSALAGTATSVDLRPKLDAWSLPARDQGPRGTCSVFAVTQAIEFALARHRDQGTRLSVEFLNWASNEAIGVRADGGFFKDLWTGFERFGICAESDLAYAERFDPDLSPSQAVRKAAAATLDVGPDHRWSMRWIKPWDVTTGLSPSEFDAIVNALDQGVPVCIGMRWPKHVVWQGTELGWAEPDDVFDGHSLLVLGYRQRDKDHPDLLFRVRNSDSHHADIELSERMLRAYVNDALSIEIAKVEPKSPAKEEAGDAAGTSAAPAERRDS